MKTLQVEQKDLAEAKKGIKEAKEEHGKVDDSLVTAREDRRSAKDQRDDTQAQVSVLNNTLSRQNSEIMKLKASIEKAKVEKTELDLLISEVGADSVEELEKNVQAQKDALAMRQNEKQSVMAELDQKNKEAGAIEDQVQQLQEKRVEHARNVALNGLEATVIAVNRDWGFVMVNVGKDLGVTADASLLVKRGGERIARLRITDISQEVLMSEVIDGSLAEGARVIPGDKVIFENTK
jgi:chromosome segregation ATPase